MMFQLLQFDENIASVTRESWCSQAKQYPSEVMVSSYERLLDWVDGVVGTNEGNIYAYALISKELPNHARAILELSHARPNSSAPWLKVLSIHIEPKLEVAVAAGENLMDLAKVVAYAVGESIGLTFKEYPSTQLKVYASTPLTLSFLEGVASFIKLEDGTDLEVTAHGNWLVVNKLK